MTVTFSHIPETDVVGAVVEFVVIWFRVVLKLETVAFPIKRI